MENHSQKKNPQHINNEKLHYYHKKIVGTLFNLSPGCFSFIKDLLQRKSYYKL